LQAAGAPAVPASVVKSVVHSVANEAWLAAAIALQVVV
jgi:hypothetical protein